MAYIFQLVKGAESIDLQYNVGAGFSLLDRGLKIGHPQRVSLFGGRLELELVKTDDGKRFVPLELVLEGASGQDLIDRVNALEAMLRDAAYYRTEDTGTEVFLRVKIDDATDAVLLPVLEGEINTSDLYSQCAEPQNIIPNLPVMVTCQPFWEAENTYTLENYVDNPGFWRGAAPGDSWAEVNGADVASTIDATVYEVMGQSLKQVYIVDAVNDTGVISDAQAVVASTEYYFEARNYRVTGCDVLTAQVYDASNAAVIAASVLTFDGAVDEWVKDGIAFDTPVGCVSVQIELYCLAVDSAGAGTAYWDAVYLDLRADAPTGWCSGRNLVNHLDAGADHLNVLCVTEIPGEVEAEIKATVDLDDITKYIRIAKRTHNDPAGYLWELNAVDATVTAGAPAYCIDSVIAPDASAPGGQRVEVTFATDKTMVRRCFWDITTDLASYYGKVALAVVAKMQGATDDCKMQIQGIDETNSDGNVTSISVGNTWWTLHDGWEVLGFRIGSSGGVLGAGNNWRISLFASTNAPAAPTDDLYIACAFLVPLDEAHLIGGGQSLGAGLADMIVQDLDGHRGLFAYMTGTDTYLPNMGAIGSYPLLTPEVENYVYFLTTLAGQEYLLDDVYRVGLEYRPRGIFLRGTDPA